jgi:HSP20 family protein
VPALVSAHVCVAEASDIVTQRHNQAKGEAMANIVRRNERESRDITSRRGYIDPVQRLDPFRMMGELLRWDPFADFERLGQASGGAGFLPAVDVRETADAFVFRADLPGVKEDDVEISLTGNRLTISGQRQEEIRDEGSRYHSYERSYGSFSRSFTLPDGADADNVRADMKDGVLDITVPKRPEVKPRRISLGPKQGGDGGGAGQPSS